MSSKKVEDALTNITRIARAHYPGDNLFAPGHPAERFRAKMYRVEREKREEVRGPVFTFG